MSFMDGLKETINNDDGKGDWLWNIELLKDALKVTMKS